MTKIPSVEERVEEFTRFGVHAYIKQTDDIEIVPIDDFFSGIVENEKGDTVVLKDWLREALTAERIALLTELRNSGLLEEYTEKSHGGLPITYEERGHNTLARAIKAHLDELIKSTSV